MEFKTESYRKSTTPGKAEEERAIKGFNFPVAYFTNTLIY